MMTTRWPSWGAASGVVLAVLWAPMGVVVWQLPDLSSAAEIERFYRSHAALLEVALGLASVGFFVFLTFAGTAFFAATAGLSFRAGAFPHWLAWTAVLAAVVNVGAPGGIFSLTGPLNAGDGAIGGPAAPILAWAVWILLASVAMLRESRRSPVMPPDHPRHVVRARRPPDQRAHEHR